MPANNTNSSQHRVLLLQILRFNPQEKEIQPRMQEFLLEERPGMTLFLALTEIRETQDPSLQFDFVCRAGICGSCGVLVNGVPRLACKVLTKDLPNNIILTPMPIFELIGDLSVNTGKWMKGLVERLQAWVHLQEHELCLNQQEMKMDAALADTIYEMDRCIECGCCLAACGSAQMNPDFIGAVGLSKIARFSLDPRDERSFADYYEIIGDENGIFGCLSLLGCHDFCPKSLPLQSQLAFLRRRLAMINSM